MKLQALWGQLADTDWELMTRAGGPGASTRPIRDGVASRWREVEVHHADLDLGFTSAQWSPAYVEMDLPRIVEGLPGRAKDVPMILSWHLRDDTSGQSWIVSVRGVRPGNGFATHALHAPGHALLAWLLGRQPAVPIQVERSSDESVALALPRYFPFG